ncbi:MAG TPA: RNA 2',3'-cyclic phosphodiesterase [Pyrinomonadaceae bacterium]|nr:RNA 2',3'-cyclic phosphodiesterase [Pyrinomonadaceae bacterium]
MTTEGRALRRIFCAVELPAGLRELVAARAARLREAFPRVRVSWVRGESLHLTLKFVGEIGPARVADLSEAAGRAAAGAGAFGLTVAGAGTFPPHGPPRVLWLGVEDVSGGLARLNRRLEDECAAAGFEREARAFSPHLTLARPRDPRDARGLAAAHRETPFEPQAFNVNELIVMESELAPGGSRYTPVSRHPL